MEIEIEILKPFFEDPDREFHIRELSRILKINHTSIRQYLNRLVDRGYLEKKSSKLYASYKSVISRKYLNLKLFYNLEKLWNSGLIEEINSKFELPPILLFGSYAQARDILTSDIDIFVISSISKEIDLINYEKKLNRKVNIMVYSHSKFENAKKNNPGLINNICNGIVLSGEFEVV